MNKTLEKSRSNWDDFFSSNEVLVPYLDACVFAIKRLKQMPKSVVYEFGCGVGNNLKFLRQLFPEARILGCDISSIAIELMHKQHVTNSHFWVNDENINFLENNIDLVIERGALQHVTKERAKSYMSEIYAAMKIGGEGYFEVASTQHGMCEFVDEHSFDPSFGYRSFYSIKDINDLFDNFKIIKIYHLSRVLEMDSENTNNADLLKMNMQGSYQIEVKKVA